MGKHIRDGRHYVSKRVKNGKCRAGMGNILLWLEQRVSENWHRSPRLDNQVQLLISCVNLAGP